jgi:hypothetical protein
MSCLASVLLLLASDSDSTSINSLVVPTQQNLFAINVMIISISNTLVDFYEFTAVKSYRFIIRKIVVLAMLLEQMLLKCYWINNC